MYVYFTLTSYTNIEQCIIAKSLLIYNTPTATNNLLHVLIRIFRYTKNYPFYSTIFSCSPGTKQSKLTKPNFVAMFRKPGHLKPSNSCYRDLNFKKLITDLIANETLKKRPEKQIPINILILKNRKFAHAKQRGCSKSIKHSPDEAFLGIMMP